MDGERGLVVRPYEANAPIRDAVLRTEELVELRMGASLRRLSPKGAQRPLRQ